MFVTPTPALMTVNAFRGKQEGTGNTSAFAPSFTKEKIVKVRKHYKKKNEMTILRGILSRIVTGLVNHISQINSHLSTLLVPNPCVTNPCLHGGRCIDTFSKYTNFPKDWDIGFLHYYCACPPDYTGQKCEGTSSSSHRQHLSKFKNIECSWNASNGKVINSR